MPFGAEYFKLEIQGDKNILKYICNNHAKSFAKIEVKDEMIMEYLDNFFRIIDSWKNKYVNNNVLDGVEWQLQISYKNGEKDFFYGKNDFPNNFETLDMIKQQLIQQATEERI